MSLGGFFRDYAYIPLGGQSREHAAFRAEHHDRVGLDGHLAWRRVELPSVGPVLGRAHPAGEVLRHEGARPAAAVRKPHLVHRAVLLRVAPVRRDGAHERGGVVLRHVRCLRVARYLHAVGAAVVELREPRARVHRGVAALGAVAAQEDPGLG